jgi:DNA-directed RNA polymerase subunit beta'
MRTTVGRIIFNRALPEELWFVNELLDRKGVDTVVARCYKHLGRRHCRHRSTISRIWASATPPVPASPLPFRDINVPEKKAEILERPPQRWRRPNNSIAAV